MSNTKSTAASDEQKAPEAKTPADLFVAVLRRHALGPEDEHRAGGGKDA